MPLYNTLLGKPPNKQRRQPTDMMCLKLSGLLQDQRGHFTRAPQHATMDHIKQGDVGPQYLAATIVNFLNFVYGLQIGWLAPMQPLLQANITNGSQSFWEPGVREMTDEGIAWLAGIFCVGGMVGTPIFGYLTNAVGRKKSLILSGIPFVLVNSLLAIATHPMYLYAARFLSGLGGAGALCSVPIYVGEIAEDRVRGILGSFLNLFICVGITLGYIIGSYTSYMFFALFSLVCAVTFLILVMWLPESPMYSLMSDRQDEAFNALVKLHGNHADHIQQQVNSMTNQVKMSGDGMSMRSMLQDGVTRKALLICLATCTIQQASGVAPVINYSVSIFQAAGSTLSPSIAAIIIAALQVVGASIATVLMDKAGRKILLMISSLGMTVTLAPIAYFLYLKNSGVSPDLLSSIGWLPVMALSVYIVVLGLGFGPVPFVFVGELFKNEAKGAATSICMTHLWSMSFVILMFFSSISSALGIEVCFMFFALSALAGAFFTHFCVLETKGKSSEQILCELSGSTPSRASPIPFLDKYGDITLESKEKA